MNKVYFSTVWEDYNSIKGAFQISRNDIVLTISSSGDNALNLLSDKPKKIIAVDYNPAHLYLGKLKLEVIKKFNLPKAIELLEGIHFNKENNKLINNIVSSDEDLKKFLSSYNFNKGINNIGSFDRRVVPILRFFIRRFLKESYLQKKEKEGQEKEKVWINILCYIFSKKSLYKILLPEFIYDYINIDIRNTLKNNIKNFIDLMISLKTGIYKKFTIENIE